MCVLSLNKSFALTGMPSREHPFLYEKRSAPCKFSFGACLCEVFVEGPVFYFQKSLLREFSALDFLDSPSQ